MSRKLLKSKKSSRKPSRKKSKISKQQSKKLSNKLSRSRNLGKKTNIRSSFIVKMSSSQVSSVNGNVRRKSKALYMNKDKAVLRTKKNGAEVTMVFKRPNVKRVTQHYIGL